MRPATRRRYAHEAGFRSVKVLPSKPKPGVSTACPYDPGTGDDGYRRFMAQRPCDRACGLELKERPRSAPADASPGHPLSPGGSAAGWPQGGLIRSAGPGGGARRVPPITWLQEKTMSSRLNPYLNFNGNARQALEFYRSVFGGTLNVNTFADFGGKDSPDADKVMHGQLETDAGYTVMAADHASNMGEYHPPSGFGISLSGDDGDILRGFWEKLSASGNPTMAMQKQAWGDEFGIVVDKFGITWLVNISQPQA